MSVLPSQAESPRSSFITNIATILGGQLATVTVALLSEVCVARLLGPAPRGQISVCTMAIWFGAVLGGLGADVPIVIWAAGHNKKPSNWVAAVLLWGMAGCSVTLYLWTLVYARWQSSSLQGVTPDLSKLVLLTIPAAILFNYLVALFTGSERFGERARVTFLRSVTSLVGFLALVSLYGRTASAALWGNYLGLVVSVTAAGFLLRSTLQRGDSATPRASKVLRSGLLVGLYGTLGNIASFFTYRLDVFIVNYFLDPAHVGLYALGVTVSESLWQIPQAAATALFPRTVRTVQEGATDFTCLIMRQVLLLSCLSGAIIALASPVAIPLIFGARFGPSVPVIWWILPGTIALCLAKVAASDLAGRSKTAYASMFGAAGFVVTVILDLVLIPRMGIEGAALASSIAYLMHGGLFLTALRHELKVGWRALLVPSRAELSRYKQACFGVVARLGLTGTPS